MSPDETEQDTWARPPSCKFFGKENSSITGGLFTIICKSLRVSSPVRARTMQVCRPLSCVGSTLIIFRYPPCCTVATS